VTDTDLVALLAGKRDVASGLQPVADVLAALSAGPSLGELAGEARALAEFRRRNVVPVPRRHARRSTAGLTSRLSAKAAAGAAAATLVLGGAATAAFANMLPAPIQRLAHDVIGAPDAPSAAQPVPARGTPTAPGQLASHGIHKSGGKSHSGSRHPNRHGHGQPGAGQGQQGKGQGQSGAGHPGQPGAGRPGQPGAGQGRQGNGLGNPHVRGQYRDPHFLWQLGDPHPPATPIAHRARPARHRPAMDT